MFRAPENIHAARPPARTRNCFVHAGPASPVSTTQGGSPGRSHTQAPEGHH